MSADNASEKQAVGVAIMLAAVAFLSGYFIYSLWSSSEPLVGAQTPPDCKDNAARLLFGDPGRLSAETPVAVSLVGCNFPQSTVVKVNGAVHGSTFVDARRIRLQLSAADVAFAGPLAITVSDGKADFGVGELTVVPPAFLWQVAGLKPFEITRELQLLLLVLLTGCFGSSILALKSLADYWGDSKLCTSWILFYTIQPLEGAGIALLTYLCIRGGFLAAGGSDIKAVNQFGVCAIAGLSGAFSDIAFAKLREVFQVLFKPQDTRGDKIGQLLTITPRELPLATSGQDYSQTLAATGGTPPFQWSVAPDLPAGLSLNKDTGAITGKPAAPAAGKDYAFTVKDSSAPAASATVRITIEVR
jgi:hypothetical protein